MRILLINTVPTDRNGITNVIFNLHRAMDKHDVCFDYVSINEPPAEYTRQIEDCGGRCYVLSRSMRGIIPYVMKLRKLIRDGHYNAVHAHGNSSTLFLEMLSAKLAGCKVRIAHGHSTSCLSVAIHKLMNPLFRACCTQRLACGVEAGKWLYGGRDFQVVNNGIDTEGYLFRSEARAEIRKKYAIPEGRIIVGHVGAFDENKNQTFLLDVLEVLYRSGSDHGLLLMGDGPLCGAAQARAEQMDIADRVIFTGAISTVAEHLSACDLVAMPSFYEGLPLSLIEEQASGLVCVVSDSITREADKTGNLVFLPLADGAERWAMVIQQQGLSVNRPRVSKEAAEKIIACGYDIDQEAAKLKEYYHCAIGKESRL